MQKEEINGVKHNLHHARSHNRDLERKLKLALNRLHSTSTKSHELRQQVPNKYYELFTEQVLAFEELRLTPTKLPEETIQRMKARCTEQAYERYEAEKDTLSNSQGIQRSTRSELSYLRPSFYVFVSQHLLECGFDPHSAEESARELPQHFYVTLRAIFDARFNDHLFSGPRLKHGFAAHCYWWLSRFEIDSQTLEIRRCKEDGRPEPVAAFYLQLMSAQVNANWEVTCFRECLFETLSPDEQHFYLSARSSLLRDDFGQSPAGRYRRIHYVPLYEAQEFWRRLLSDLGYRRSLEEFMKASVLYRNRVPLVDSHYLLRIILECYQLKKRALLQQLKAFAADEFDSEDTIGFGKCVKILDHGCPWLSPASKAELYRKCYGITKGLVTLDSILLVLQEEGLMNGAILRAPLSESITLKYGETVRSAHIYYIEPSHPELYLHQSEYIAAMHDHLRPLLTKLGAVEADAMAQQCETLTEATLFRRIEFILRLQLLTLRKLLHSQGILSITQI